MCFHSHTPMMRIYSIFIQTFSLNIKKKLRFFVFVWNDEGKYRRTLKPFFALVCSRKSSYFYFVGLRKFIYW